HRKKVIARQAGYPDLAMVERVETRRHRIAIYVGRSDQSRIVPTLTPPVGYSVRMSEHLGIGSIEQPLDGDPMPKVHDKMLGKRHLEDREGPSTPAQGIVH